jgi:hypothetical protein
VNIVKVNTDFSNSSEKRMSRGYGRHKGKGEMMMRKESFVEYDQYYRI